jgi:LPXTG-site transpeptidase (sortase) family protein
VEYHVDRRSVLTALGGAVVLGSISGIVLGLDDAADAAPAPPPVGIATLVVPKIKMKRPVFEGTSLTVLNNGPGHKASSAMPGQPGHCVIFGHRTSHGGPFRKINLLKVGDAITCGGLTYYVRKTEVIPKKQMRRIFTFEAPTPAISLIACSKANGQPTSLGFRICVRASA